MKLGTENKFETLVAIILGICAIGSVAYWLLSSTAPAHTATPNASKAASANRSLINPLDPTLRVDLLDSAQNVKYEGKGRNIFRLGTPVDIPKPQGPVLTGKKQPTPPPPVVTTPPPPPINIKFFGVASRNGEQARIFLAEGDSVFVAREGDIVDSRYKVVKINPQSVEIEDLLNNNRQSIPLTQG